MKFDKPLSSLLLAAMLGGAFTAVSAGQQTAGPGTAAAAAPAGTAAPLTEEVLRSRYLGKLIFLRGLYQGDDLHFDENGKIEGSPATASFTLSALEVKKINLSKHKLEIEADRYGLHFFGALPYQDDSKPFDRVRISKKPVHIVIDRELVVIPKAKKEKKGAQKAATAAGAKAGAGPGAAPAATAAAIPPAAPDAAAQTTTSPAHSAMLMNSALDNVFANDIDQRMLAHLPDYWQLYYESKKDHREFMPTDTAILAVGDGITPPKVLNSIDPSSNEYAQKYGIAGLALLRTVVDATGHPQEIAIARPIGFGLDEAAVNAIKTSHFTPALQNGHPVPVVVDLVVTFRIYSNRTKPGSVSKGSKATVLAASTSDAAQPGAKMLK